jgi:hypothetical protein
MATETRLVHNPRRLRRYDILILSFRGSLGPLPTLLLSIALKIHGNVYE